MSRVYAADDARRGRIADELRVELSRSPDVAFAFLYGSFAESSQFRDVDIGVYLAPIEADRGAARALALAKELGQSVGFPVDVRVLNHAPVTFLFHVLRGRLLLSRDEGRLDALIERTARHYLDIEPVLRQGAKDAFAA